MNKQAAACVKAYKAERELDPTASMKSAVESYLDEHDGSFESIMRTLNDNPDQWKNSG